MKKILPLLVAVLFYSCHNESNTDYEGEPITQNFEISDDIAFEQEITESKRKLIKTGEVIFKPKVFLKPERMYIPLLRNIKVIYLLTNLLMTPTEKLTLYPSGYQQISLMICFMRQQKMS